MRKRDIRKTRRAGRAWTPTDGIAMFTNRIGAMRAAHSTDPLQREELTSLSLRFESALYAIRQGLGDDTHAETLINVLNLSKALADAGLGAEWDAVIQRAGAALLDMGARCAAQHRFDTIGTQADDLAALLELFDAQLRDPAMTEGALVAATIAVRRQIEAGNIETPDSYTRSMASADRNAA